MKIAIKVQDVKGRLHEIEISLFDYVREIILVWIIPKSNPFTK
jgi:hypothetical protein